ncbi:hypothetical protein F2Q69_00023377 [Brassica cretica]|uniref:Uncharacterized protein n=1 Tax=Brassica cretica TaxID=69181 RepID=A0A8S9Q4G5_BRACR|nr:hypothetical protein F2Q69_00023377 [Brassica cretica]
MNLGLVKRIGDGKDSNVWSTNWLVDTSARPPMYRQDSLVDLMLKVCDLFIPNTELWDREKVRETFTPEDAELDSWSLIHVHGSRNRVSPAIAVSVTSDLCTQSYVATGGPSWLSDTILSEAQAM